MPHFLIFIYPFSLQENRKPLSAFEQRNAGSDPALASVSKPMRIFIGGKDVKVLGQKGDLRGELRDKNGKYLDGQDRGLMKVTPFERLCDITN